MGRAFGLQLRLAIFLALGHKPPDHARGLVRAAAEHAALQLFLAAREFDADKSSAKGDFALGAAHELLRRRLEARGEVAAINAHSPVEACRYLARQFIVNACALYLMRLMRGDDLKELNREYSASPSQANSQSYAKSSTRATRLFCCLS